MSRVKTILTVGGIAVAAAATGCAVGLMIAPASGRELRRRAAWLAAYRWRAVSHSCERTFDRIADRARREIEDRTRQASAAIGT